jgi:hypothetical protein
MSHADDRREDRLAHRPVRWCALIAAVLFSSPGLSQQSDLPTGFGGINVGDKWEDVADNFELQDLDSLATPWDTYVQECGYRNALLEAENGKLIITFEDFVVTDLSYITPIKPETNLLTVADLVMQNYGQPDRASMRNIFGRVTIDKDQVNFITLTYGSPRTVEFNISGRDLWEYRIAARYPRKRWHENNTLRCARAREKQAAKTAAAEAAQ